MPLLKLLSAHKGKGALALIVGACVLLASRGCRVSIDVDPIHARTNETEVIFPPLPSP